MWRLTIATRCEVLAAKFGKNGLLSFCQCSVRNTEVLALSLATPWLDLCPSIELRKWHEARCNEIWDTQQSSKQTGAEVRSLPMEEQLTNATSARRSPSSRAIVSRAVPSSSSVPGGVSKAWRWVMKPWLYLCSHLVTQKVFVTLPFIARIKITSMEEPQLRVDRLFLIVVEHDGTLTEHSVR
jgi:hypothetical protein